MPALQKLKQKNNEVEASLATQLNRISPHAERMRDRQKQIQRGKRKVSLLRRISQNLSAAK